MENTDFTTRLDLLLKSGAGVIFVRSPEPERVREHLTGYTLSRNKDLFEWKLMRGWHNEQTEASNGVGDPIAALDWVGDWKNRGDTPQDSGVYLMHAIEGFLKAPEFSMMLADYVHSFPLSGLRLILLLPVGCTIPDELRNIPILEFGLPNESRLEEALEWVIDSAHETHKTKAQAIGKKAGPAVTYRDIFSGSEVRQITSAAGGLTVAQAELAFSVGIMSHQQEQWHQIDFANFLGEVMSAKTEVVQRSEALELLSPVPMDQIGGLELIKEWIANSAVAFTPEAQVAGVDAPQGFCAVGPPGTGKTLLGQASASYLGLPLVKVNISALFGGLVGETEKKTREMISMVEGMGDVVLLLDEVDKALGGSHMSGGDSGVTRRLLGTLLSFLQDTKARVYPIFTANRVEGLPPELLRKGRIDEVWAVLPPTATERRAILGIHLRKRKEDPEVIEDLQMAVDAGKGLVSSEIEGAVKEAKLLSYRTGHPITGVMIADLMRMTTPISVAMKDDFDRMLAWAKDNARMASRQDEEEEDGAQAQGERVAKPRKRRNFGGGGGLN